MSGTSTLRLPSPAQLAGERAASALPALAVIVLASAVWAYLTDGYATFDTAYAVVWGDELVTGARPDYDIPLAPTPHPLATAIGGVASLFGSGAYGVFAAIVFLAMGALVWSVYRIGRDCFSWRVGLLAAIVVATSPAIVARTGSRSSRASRS